MTLAALLACTFFYCTGRAFIPHLGIQNDEALFGAGIYPPPGFAYARWVFGHRIPLMLMSYLGMLKGWLYALIFEIWRPTASSIRTPMLLAGVLTVWLFYRFLCRVADRRAAIAGCLLLATDSTFLLTDTFDWGPVALQHLFLTAALLLLVHFYQRGALASLAGGFFMLGLGAWDKALFCWLLAGLAAAAAVVIPKELIRTVTPSRLAIAACAFALGALPLLLYNGSNRMATFRSNASWSAEELPGKARVLRYTLEGNSLFGWLVADDAPEGTPPRTAIQRASARLSAAAGHPRRNLMGYAFLLALALWPLLWRTCGWSGAPRAMLFALVFMAVAWVQMAFTKGAGAVHHSILLWPFPHFFIAAGLAGASRLLRRYGAAVLAALLVPVLASNLLVTNEYYRSMVRNGGALNWSDSIYPLAAYLRTFPAENVFITDWGVLDSLRLLTRGRLALRVGSDPVSKPALDAADRQLVRDWVSNSANLFVGHTEGNEFFPGNSKKLQALAAELGFTRELLTVIPDSRGRPMVEVFRFHPA